MARQSEALTARLPRMLAEIEAADPAVRYATLSTLAREVFKEYSVQLKEPLADPRTIDVLLRALTDSDPKVAEKAAGVISVIVSRYAPERRTFEPMAALLASSRKQTRVYAVFALAHLAHGEDWRVLLPAFVDPAREVRHAACRAVVFNLSPDELPPATRDAVQAAVQQRQSDPDPATRKMAEKALRKLA